jgi:transcriptional regulator of acetoin/glycerol metabolism
VKAWDALKREQQAETYRRALEECGGNRTQAAKRLGVSRQSFVAALKRLGIV